MQRRDEKLGILQSLSLYSLLLSDMVNGNPGRRLLLLFLSLPKPIAHPLCPQVPSPQPADTEPQEPLVSREQ